MAEKGEGGLSLREGEEAFFKLGELFLGLFEEALQGVDLSLVMLLCCLPLLVMVALLFEQEFDED